MTTTTKPATPAPKGKLGARLARNKKPLLALGAGVVVVLALWARQKAAGDTSDGVTGEGIYAAGSTSTPSAYLPGTATYDSSITDLYNAMQTQLEDFLGRIPVPDTTPVPDPPVLQALSPDAGMADKITAAAAAAAAHRAVTRAGRP